MRKYIYIGSDPRINDRVLVTDAKVCFKCRKPIDSVYRGKYCGDGSDKDNTHQWIECKRDYVIAWLTSEANWVRFPKKDFVENIEVKSIINLLMYMTCLQRRGMFEELTNHFCQRCFSYFPIGNAKGCECDK
jgi:hypothetical protein